MKKKILTALILSAMMTASFASCGNTKDNDSSKADTNSTASADSVVTDEEDTTAEEEKEEEPTAEEDSSAADDDSSKSDDSAPEDTEPEISQHESDIASIAAYTFESGNTFSDLNKMGLANAYENGKAYAIVPLEGGAAAGSVYYGVFNSTDGGANWLPCENYREANGTNTHIALDDGAILLISTGSARQETYPVVSYLYFDGIGIKAVELTDVLAKLELTDGTLLKDAENYGVEAAYSKGYKVDLTVTDYNSYETVYEGQFDFADAIETALNAQ
ncbi:hypothetical protein [Ruminococcus albus]|uniref:hypothetical protein n=1 Tax=Ruminococcus albus TaxID=1264 RepID=UPI000466C8BE|nr:hypothetical protein [Ruminococcus albus]